MTPKVKALRTGLQTVVAVAAYIVAIATLPEVREFLAGRQGLSALIIPLLSATFAYIQNKAGK